jgi:hypothetical protein
MKTNEILKHFTANVFYSAEDEGFIAYYLELGMDVTG